MRGLKLFLHVRCSSMRGLKLFLLVRCSSNGGLKLFLHVRCFFFASQPLNGVSTVSVTQSVKATRRRWSYSKMQWGMCAVIAETHLHLSPLRLTPRTENADSEMPRSATAYIEVLLATSAKVQNAELLGLNYCSLISHSVPRMFG